MKENLQNLILYLSTQLKTEDFQRYHNAACLNDDDGVNIPSSGITFSIFSSVNSLEKSLKTFALSMWCLSINFSQIEHRQDDGSSSSSHSSYFSQPEASKTLLLINVRKIP